MVNTDQAQALSPRIRTAIRESWDREAYRYDLQYGHGLLSPAESDAWMLLLRRLLPPEQPVRVLDVGTGTGFLAIMLAELGHAVAGIDISEAMLAAARDKSDGLGLDIEFLQSDGESVPFPEESFDAVISRHLLWTLVEPERALREWARVTRPGGSVIAIDGLWHPTSLSEQVVGWLGAGIRRIQERNLEPRQRYQDDVWSLLPLMGLRSPVPAANAFARAGLHGVRTEELTWIDTVERTAMPLAERWTNRYRRYLVEGTR